jgi:hypothetical protein
MNWLTSEHCSVARSEDGIYELAGRYINGAFAWRARVIDTDVLVASSADRGYVEGCVDRHRASAIAEHRS